MTAALTPVPKIQFFADDGTPLVGGKLYSYAAGSTTPLATYTTYAGTVANTNPVILDSRGEANVWLGAFIYKLALYDADDALIWTVDNILGNSNVADFLASAVADQFSGTGSQTVFTLTGSPGSQAALKVSVDGLTFVPNVDYIWSGGTTLTFTVAPISGAQILVQYAISVQQNSNVFTTLLVSQPVAASNDVGTLKVSRIAGYTGGTPGFVNSAIRADTAVAAGVTAYEWAITGVMDNSAVAGQNVGGYFQGKKNSTGPTWGAVAEVIETTAVNDPTTGTVALEVDVNCNGTDAFGAYGSRVGVDLAIRKYSAAGVAANVAWGFRIQNGGDATSVVDRGFSFFPGMICNKAFDASTATCITAAFQMETNQIFSFNSSTTRQLSHNGSGWVFKDNTTINYWGLNDNFTLTSNGVQLLGTRKTGWGVATNGSRAALNGSTATLAQTSAAVAQLIIDLTAHGLIGA